MQNLSLPSSAIPMFLFSIVTDILGVPNDPDVLSQESPMHSIYFHHQTGRKLLVLNFILCNYVFKSSRKYLFYCFSIFRHIL